ncbi:MAG: hypothetical protein OEZ01_16145, partial [Candidatus Heimdallarchaeota archaeon]|nr:hypothetical protein [Candidatus Heimdallarchaeota archaeon]
LVETNSCPSGQKSFPMLDDTDERGSYRLLIEKSFLPSLEERELPNGSLAVLYDKNHIEASGYAATIADLTNEDVFLIKYYSGNEENTDNIRFRDGVLEVMYEGNWQQIKAAFKYVTQKPWNRIPINTKTLIYNPIIVCLAGGRNKLIASKAYDIFNGELRNYGLEIRVPETIWDVSKREVPLWVDKMGGFAVIKNPYSNAGQGVYTITNKEELNKFMQTKHSYDLFIVQSLIGNSTWSSIQSDKKLYHIGTVPNKKNHFFVADLRMMICSTEVGYRPVALYARQAHKPLKTKLDVNEDSWQMLGTNLSIKLGENSWDSDINRLVLMDSRDFNRLGLGLDDLIEGFIQTVLANIAIDKMADNLINSEKKLKVGLFRSLNNDESLINEIIKE